MYLSFLTSGGGCTHPALTLPFTPSSESTPTHVHVHMYVCTRTCRHRHRHVPCCRPRLSPLNLPSPWTPLLEQQGTRALWSGLRPAAPEKRPGQGLICQLPPCPWPLWNRRCTLNCHPQCLTQFPGHLHHQAASSDLCLGGGRQPVGA